MKSNCLTCTKGEVHNNVLVIKSHIIANHRGATHQATSGSFATLEVRCEQSLVSWRRPWSASHAMSATIADTIVSSDTPTLSELSAEAVEAPS